MLIKLTVLYPSGHRRNAKASANTTVFQTLEEVCEKESLDAGSYSFLFQRKILEESISWRFANVPNNAKLELVKREKEKSETPVRIALQHDGGNRLQGSFLPSVTLSDILAHWKSELSTLTPPEGQEHSILYLRQEITGNVKLSSTTLKSLGLTSGSAILRLSYKPVTRDDLGKEVKVKKHVEKKSPSRVDSQGREILPAKEAQPSSKTKKVPTKSSGEIIITQEMLQNALMQVSEASASDNMEILSASSSSTDFVDAMDQFPTDVSKTGRARSRRPNSSETMPKKKVKAMPEQQDFSDFHFPKETEGMDVYSRDSENDEVDIRPLMQPCDREAIFFDEGELETREIASEDPGDEFFELTVDDMRKMLSELRSLQNESDDKPLLTARSRELHRLRAINQYSKIVIRIVFPNRKIAQGIFRPAETVQSVYEFVKKYLSNPKIDFYLYTTPPKVILKDKKSILYDNRLAPASKVYFGLTGQEFDSTVLSSECEGSALEANLKLQSVFEMKSPVQAKQELRYDFNGTTATGVHPSLSEVDAPSTSHQGQTSHPSGGARPKVPKWFKMGK